MGRPVSPPSNAHTPPPAAHPPRLCTHAGSQTAALCLCWLLLPCASLALLAGLALGPALCSAVVTIFVARTVRVRAAGFALQFACRLGVIGATAATGAGHWPAAWLATHLAVEAAPLLGSVLNVLRLPEALAPAGHPLFTYVLQSHTLMHVLVGVGMLGNHFLALTRAAHVADTPALLSCARAHTATLAGLLGRG